MATPPDDERERLLTLYRHRVDGYGGVGADFGWRWRRWCRILLAYGGSLVVPPPGPESDLDALLAGAAVFGSAVRSRPGDAGECHRNVSALWIEGTVTGIGTGYALSDDGLWRQHSWGVDPDSTVVETTDERRQYVGFILPAGAPSMQFAGSNAQEHLRVVLRRQGPRATELVGMIRELAQRPNTGPVRPGVSARHSPAMSNRDPVWVLHDDPVIRERESYLADVDLSGYDLPGQFEQLWLRPIGTGVYEVTCLPFCVYGLAFLDRVALTDDGRSVSRVIEPSGRRVLRVLLMESYGERLTTVVDGIRSMVVSLGLHSEWRGGRHVAIDVPRGVVLDELFGLLQDDADAQHAYWEWGDVLPFVPPA